MNIHLITKNKKRYLDLLLLADENEKMIDKYLELGNLFVLCDDDLKSLCVVVSKDNSYEIKNLATKIEYQNKGYGKKLVNFVLDYYKRKNNFKHIYVGTGETKKLMNFYQSLGFKKACKIKNFFIDNCDIPIIDEGKQIKDMIYLKRNL
ncbi:GNAT family N-acetyltransferase [Methanobrevibacter sp. DSM 116169]|uniref:GNAT family N-acetyltransferase n=1 Tax=Methanobrevibacter sp. DSM 116169 TaxID=3242727 RepID=UPI0038FC6CB6